MSFGRWMWLRRWTGQFGDMDGKREMKQRLPQRICQERKVGGSKEQGGGKEDAR